MAHLTVTSWARPDVWKLYLHLKKNRKYKHSISKGVLQVKNQATSEVQINKIEILCQMFVCRSVYIFQESQSERVEIKYII